MTMTELCLTQLFLQLDVRPTLGLGRRVFSLSTWVERSTTGLTTVSENPILFNYGQSEYGPSENCEHLLCKCVQVF